MKKYIHAATALLLACILSSCIDDKGNYLYIDKEEIAPVQISNIDKEYTVLTGQSFTLDPLVEGIDNEDDHDYLWCIYGIGLSRTGWKDTIGREKNLDYHVTISSGTYRVTYKITSKHTGISAYFSTDVRVISDFSHGWFITKDSDDVTDVDMIDMDGRIFPDLVRSINGSGVPGKAIKTTYIPNGYNYVEPNPDGTVNLHEYQKAFFIVTESDFNVVSGENFKRYANFDESFYELPATKKPRDIVVGTLCANLLNDGKLHEMPVVYANAARFGNPLIGSTSIAPYFFRHTANGYLAFDQESCSFKVSVFWQPSLQAVAEDETSPVSCNNMEYDLVFMQEQAAFYSLTKKGLALFRHRGTGTYHGAVLDARWMDFSNPIASFLEVPAGSQGVTRASLRAVHNINDVIYYSDGGNTIGMYNVSNGVEKSDILVYDEGESVASLEHVSYHSSSTALPSPDCLVVLTNKAGKWKMYLYNFTGYTADVESTPYQIHEGEGNARDVLYRAPASPATN
ncbi:MAG: hypothetical protein LBF09_00655 [Odoribacteraceae bacterium]|jgi:hypothetical protein|nr:hypothetical protein [Odoribacteraceae bacterium]